MNAPGAYDWVGSVLTGNRYLVTAKLGEGGMGFVYRAQDRNLEQDVVIKVPRRQVLDDAEFALRFASEIRSLVKLTHPHVVKVLDAGQHDSLPYAVMQFLGGGSLEARRSTGARGEFIGAPTGTLYDWLPAMGGALDFVHSQGYVHRDVKPANILFDSHGNAFLGDFGVAKVVSAARDSQSNSAQTGTGMVMGTPDYLAPELIMGQPFDGRVDQYALAATVFEMLTGRPPFVGPTPSAVLVAHSTKVPPLAHTLNPQVPPQLSAVLHRALTKSPRERFASCTEFAQAVCALAGTRVEAAVVQEPPKRFGRMSRIKGQRGTCPVCNCTITVSEKSRGAMAACPGCKSPLSIGADLKSIAEVLAPPPAQATSATAPSRGPQTVATTPPPRPNYTPTTMMPAMPAAAPPPISGSVVTQPPVAPSANSRRMLIGALAGFAAVVLLGMTILLVTSGTREEPVVRLQLLPIAEQSIAVDAPFTLALELEPTETPHDPARFELVGKTPSGMTIDAQSGKITWPVTADRKPGNYPIVVRAIIRDHLASSDEVAFNLHVEPPKLAESTPKESAAPSPPSPPTMPLNKGQTPSKPSTPLPTLSIRSKSPGALNVGDNIEIEVNTSGPLDADSVLEYRTDSSNLLSPWLAFSGQMLAVRASTNGSVEVQVRIRRGSESSNPATARLFVRPLPPGMNPQPPAFAQSITQLISDFQVNARAHYRQNHEEDVYQREVTAVRSLVDLGRTNPQVVEALLEEFAKYNRDAVEQPKTKFKVNAQGHVAPNVDRYINGDALQAFDPNGIPFMRDISMRDQPGSAQDAIGSLYQRSLALAPENYAAPTTFAEIGRQELPNLRLILYIGPPAIPALKAGLDRPLQRPCSLTCLARLGPAAIGPLLEALKSDNAELRAGAIAMLAYNLKSPASFALQQSNAEQFALATQALSAALRDPEENVRLHALHALVGWAPTNEVIVKQYVAELPKLIDQSHGEQIRRIMLLLNHLGPGAAPALSNIVAAIRRDKAAMPHGVDLLAHYGVPGQGALTTLAADP